MYESILVPIDLDHSSSWRATVPVALDLAKAFRARLHLISVVPDLKATAVGIYLSEDFAPRAEEQVQEKLDAFAAANIPDDIRGETRVAHGDVGEEILDTADALGCDLIVMAPHRPEMKDFFISPSTGSVVLRANRSVLVVRDQAADGA